MQNRNTSRVRDVIKKSRDYFIAMFVNVLHAHATRNVRIYRERLVYATGDGTLAERTCPFTRSLVLSLFPSFFLFRFSLSFFRSDM